MRPSNSPRKAGSTFGAVAMAPASEAWFGSRKVTARRLGSTLLPHHDPEHQVGAANGLLARIAAILQIGLTTSLNHRASSIDSQSARPLDHHREHAALNRYHLSARNHPFQSRS